MKKSSSCKGTVQVDYVFAVSAFIITFALLVQYTTDYYTNTNELTDTMLLRSDALGLLSVADCDNRDECLQSPAYRFFILLNNTQENLINQSDPVTDLTNELVIFNMYDIADDIDLNSVSVYYAGTPVEYQRTGDEITFSTDISANQAKFFAVYFDDDSSFADRSAAVTGNNVLNEKIFSVERLHLLQYKRLEQLISSSYNYSADIPFHITIKDSNDENFLDYGSSAPERSNVVALQKYVVFQNSTGEIEFGRFIVQVW